MPTDDMRGAEQPWYPEPRTGADNICLGTDGVSLCVRPTTDQPYDYLVRRKRYMGKMEGISFSLITEREREVSFILQMIEGVEQPTNARKQHPDPVTGESP